MTPIAVEQVFLTPRGGGTDVLLVLEDEAGGRTRERTRIPTGDLEAATKQTAKRLSWQGIRPARKVRLRVDRGGELVDDPRLLEVFLGVLTGKD